jgi:hypothetical protein
VLHVVEQHQVSVSSPAILPADFTGAGRRKMNFPESFAALILTTGGFCQLEAFPGALEGRQQGGTEQQGGTQQQGGTSVEVSEAGQAPADMRIFSRWYIHDLVTMILSLVCDSWGHIGGGPSRAATVFWCQDHSYGYVP